MLRNGMDRKIVLLSKKTALAYSAKAVLSSVPLMMRGMIVRPSCYIFHCSSQRTNWAASWFVVE